MILRFFFYKFYHFNSQWNYNYNFENVLEHTLAINLIKYFLICHSRYSVKCSARDINRKPYNENEKEKKMEWQRK